MFSLDHRYTESDIWKMGSLEEDYEYKVVQSKSTYVTLSTSDFSQTKVHIIT